jgi:LacI family transcriptional regulator, repressor for deo operon, udp, cdd, tsx, nupC, and nupG
MGRATINDVAQRSGVSVATVSRAVRGLPNVSPATRRRVLASAAELRYQPNANAAGLVTGKTGVVTMGVMVITSWYAAQVMAGAEAVLSDSGIELSVIVLVDAPRQSDRLDHRMLSNRSDGLILVDFAPESLEPDPTFSTVIVGARSQGFDSVAIDNVAGGRMAGEHLMQLGHTRVGVIAGSRGQSLSQSNSDRMSGFLESARRYGVDEDGVAEQYGNYSALGGYEAMGALLSVPPNERPTAVFALSDEMAVGAIKAAADLGCRVPEDLSVVGFDDHELAFGFGLTTIAQEPATLGATGAAMLIDRLGGLDAPSRTEESSIKLVVRSSTRSLET